MRYTVRRASALVVIAGLGAMIAIYEPHRHLVAWVFPFATEFWFTYIAG
jgi:hypothetical protein